MAVRTTAGAVRAVLMSNVVADANLTPFIDAASSTVDAVKARASAKGTPLSFATLELIERWLAAHYYTRSDPLYTSKRTGDASGSFQERSYLEVAQALDTTGSLAAILSGKRATMAWLGKTESEALSYEERNL
jgi:hypothetical protein